MHITQGICTLPTRSQHLISGSRTLNNNSWSHFISNLVSVHLALYQQTWVTPPAQYLFTSRPARPLMMQHLVWTTKDLLHKLSETVTGLVTCGSPSLPTSGLTSGLPPYQRSMASDSCVLFKEESRFQVQQLWWTIPHADCILPYNWIHHGPAMAYLCNNHAVEWASWYATSVKCTNHLKVEELTKNDFN